MHGAEAELEGAGGEEGRRGGSGGGGKRRGRARTQERAGFRPLPGGHVGGHVAEPGSAPARSWKAGRCLTRYVCLPYCLSAWVGGGPSSQTPARPPAKGRSGSTPSLTRPRGLALIASPLFLQLQGGRVPQARPFALGRRESPVGRHAWASRPAGARPRL